MILLLLLKNRKHTQLQHLWTDKGHRTTFKRTVLCSHPNHPCNNLLQKIQQHYNQFSRSVRTILERQ